MVSKFLTVTNAQGFHMRVAGTFVSAMEKYPCKVTIKFKGNEYNAKSVFDLMTACMKCGSEIELICDGEQENEALAEGAKMIEDGFGE